MFLEHERLLGEELAKRECWSSIYYYYPFTHIFFLFQTVISVSLLFHDDDDNNKCMDGRYVT